MSDQEEVTLGEVHRTLMRVEAKVDEKADKETADRIEGKVDKTNGRVTSLEAWKNRAMGAWFVVSFAGPIITGLIVKYG